MRITYFLLAIAILSLTTPILADSGKPINLALIADQTSGLDKSPLISLLEIELSQRDDIRLLERAAIDKILEEQKLSAAGLLDRNNTIKIGKLLRADAFIILSTEKSTPDSNNASPNQASSDLIRVRVSETAHGLRLLDCFAQSDSNSVGTIVQKLESVLNKINQPNKKLIPVGIVDIHRVQLAKQYKMLERTLPVLLSVRLNLEPQIIMLEREDLKVLLDEKLMTEGEDTKFWSSAILIDGYIQPNNGQLELHLNLKQAAGENLKSLIIPVEPNEPANAIVKATSEITQQLQNSPPAAKWQPEQEAEQFYKQGQMLFNQQKYEGALSLFETAHALQPQNLYYTQGVFNSEWSLRKRINSHFYKGDEKPQYSDIELAEIVSIYVRQLSRWYDDGLLTKLDIWNAFEEGLGGYFNKYFSVSTEEIKKINRENRRIWKQTALKSVEGMQQLQRSIGIELASSDVLEEVLQNIKDLTVNSSISKSLIEWQQFLFNPRISKNTEANKTTQFRESADKCWELWLGFIHELTESSDPLMKFTSYLALYKHTEPQNEEYRKLAIKILQNDLKTPNEPYNDFIKQTIRHIIKSYISNAEFEELLKPLIENKDISNLVLWNPGEINQTSIFHKNEKYYYLLEQISTVLQQKKNDHEVAGILATIEEIQGQIQKQYPSIKVTSKESNYAVKILVKKEDWPNHKKTYSSYHQIFLENEKIWIAFQSGTGTLFLTGINLLNKKPVALWQAELPYIQDNPLDNSGFLSGISISDKVSYLSFNGRGLVEFPGSTVSGSSLLNNPRILNEKHGLPSIYISSMAKYKNKLYVGYGGYGKESGLGLYDPQKNNWETVFCSSIKDSNPFSKGGTYTIETMLYDNKNTLFFYFSDILHSIELKGLWTLNTDTKEMKYLGPVSGNIILDSENKALISSRRFLFKVESDSEGSVIGLKDTLSKNTVSSQRRKYPSRNYGVGILIDYDLLESLIDYSFPLFYLDTFNMTTSALHNNTLWVILGENRLFILGMGQSADDAQIIDNNILNGEPVYRFVSTPYGLVAIGKGTVGLIETENIDK